MTILLPVLLVFSAIYCITLLLFWVGLWRPAPQRTRRPLSMSVVIPIKNERARLPVLLDHLRQQEYPADLYEVIIIDDHSTDGSLEYLQAAALQFPQMRVIDGRQYSSQYRYKKAPMDLGIRLSKGEVILSTDADCRMGPDWISGMAAYFQEDVAMVVGFSGVRAAMGLFSKLQSLDFLLLMGAAQGALNLELSWGCSGQNLAYRKSVFEEVNGYAEISDRVGGDDSLFMQLIRRHKKGKIVFAADPQARVQNLPVPELSTFLRQRIRWASEANYMHRLNPVFFAVVLSAFVVNISALAALVGWCCGLLSLPAMLALTGSKLLVELTLCMKVSALYQEKGLRKWFPLWFLLQMPYVIAMGVGSFWGNRLGWGTK